MARRPEAEARLQQRRTQSDAMRMAMLTGLYCFLIQSVLVLAVAALAISHKADGPDEVVAFWPFWMMVVPGSLVVLAVQGMVVMLGSYWVYLSIGSRMRLAGVLCVVLVSVPGALTQHGLACMRPVATIVAYPVFALAVAMATMQVISLFTRENPPVVAGGQQY